MAAGWALLPVLAGPVSIHRRFVPTEERVRTELAHESLVRQAFDLKANGDLDGAIALLDQLIKEKDSGGREFTIISWLLDANRDAETLPYFRAVYGQRLEMHQRISTLSLLYTYAEIAAEHGNKEDVQIIIDTMRANAPDQLSDVERILADNIRKKAASISGQGKS
jgi:hypothetical protein